MTEITRQRIQRVVTSAQRKLSSLPLSLAAQVRPAAKYAGVRPVQIYALRVVFALMFFVLGQQTWAHILTHRGSWEPTAAVAWCVWTAFATLAGLGILRPLTMLPIILLEIFYKVLWLVLVAYPLWSKHTLAGSAAEGTTWSFLWVLLPIVATPWGYAFVHYIYDPANRRAIANSTALQHCEGETWPAKE